MKPPSKFWILSNKYKTRKDPYTIYTIVEEKPKGIKCLLTSTHELLDKQLIQSGQYITIRNIKFKPWTLGKKCDLLKELMNDKYRWTWNNFKNSKKKQLTRRQVAELLAQLI